MSGHSVPNQAGSGLLMQQPSPEHLVSVLVDQLEALACASPDNTIPATLQAIVDHTLERIRRPYLPMFAATAEQQADLSEQAVPKPDHSDPQEDLALDEAWQCLAELLCDEDEYAASVGQSWLYRLLTEAAEHQVAQTDQQSTSPEEDPEHVTAHYDEQQLVLGLLPHPLGGPPKPDAPAHLTQQPELAGLLRLVLSYSGGGVDVGHRFMMVVRRLVLHLKLKCSGLSSG